ncbi:signal peptidase I [Candidatus Kaiserbacteria bacterium]|nr:MAG: signal peptidase I [Candidatus Kaiserbacteria bacterium]
MKIFITIFYSFFTVLLIGVAGLFLAPLSPLDTKIEIKIVESGSMEPAILTGSVVVIGPTGKYETNDVITFKSPSAEIPTTHRIVSSEERNGTTWFTTKGDANEEADTEQIPLSAILGEVVVAVPYVGFILDFARQPMGFGFLIVLPALMIIFGEIEKIWREIRKNKKDKGDDTGSVVVHDVRVDLPPDTRQRVRMIEIGRPIVSYQPVTKARHLPMSVVRNTKRHSVSFGDVAIGAFSVVASVCIVGLGFVGSTVSYFGDSESSVQNTLQAQALDFTLSVNDTAYSFIGSELDDADGALIAVVTPAEGSTDIKYRVHTNVVGDNTLFCQSILVDAGAPLMYQGSLVNLSASDVVFDEPWTLSLSLPVNYGPFGEGEVCVIDIEYTAWDATGPTGVGYDDSEKISLTFTAPTPIALPRALPSVEPLMMLPIPPVTTDEVVQEVPLEEEVAEDVEDPIAQIVPEVPEEIIEDTGLEEIPTVDE